MKKQIITASLLTISLIAEAQWTTMPTLPGGNDAVVNGPAGTWLRNGHLQSGTYNNGWGTWSCLGTPILSVLGNTPNDQTLYGLTINNDGDRCFFGSRNKRPGTVQGNQADAIVAWGDDNWANTGGNPDRLKFEFHDSNAGGGTTIREAMVMMPNPASNGVYVGIGTANPTEQLHTTQFVRHQGMIPGPITNLVGIDASGVLWRAPLTANTFGNVCTATTKNPLTNDWEIPMSTFNYVFTGQGINNTNVGIGTGCAPSAKLHVNQSSGSTNGSIGILVENNDLTSCFNTNPVIGLKSVVNLNNSISNISGLYRVGGWFEVPNPNGCGLINDYALFVPQNGGHISFGYPVPTSTGALVDINGDLQVAGNCWNNTTLIFSDKRFKKNIKSLENINEKIKKVNGYSYDYKTDEFKDKGFDNKSHIGFIAQEINEVFPELVKQDSKGYYAVDYQGMVPVLLVAIKEQQAQIDELKEMVKSLANAGTPKDDNSRAVNLSDKNVLVLNQNVPNPFAESTVITYNIPTDFTKAQLIFTTIEGKVINTVEVTTKGEGRLNVFANDLSSGMYSYTLVVDGKTIDTKKMVKQ